MHTPCSACCVRVVIVTFVVLVLMQFHCELLKGVESEVTVKGEADLLRLDCSIGSHRADWFGSEKKPRVSYIGRLKSAPHHAKAGNMNHTIYNEVCVCVCVCVLCL
jgi:hypothetical protein